MDRGQLMKAAEPGWGTYALEVVHTREEAERRYAEWERKAAAIPGAEVRYLSWTDPLGSETFVFCTETYELLPPAMRRPLNALLPRLAEMKQQAPAEDLEAYEFLERFLRGKEDG